MHSALSQCQSCIRSDGFALYHTSSLDQSSSSDAPIDYRIKSRVNLSPSMISRAFWCCSKHTEFPVCPGCRDQEEQRLCPGITGTLGHDIVWLCVHSSHVQSMLCVQLIKDDRMVPFSPTALICLCRFTIPGKAVGDRMVCFLPCQTLSLHPFHKQKLHFIVLLILTAVRGDTVLADGVRPNCSQNLFMIFR